jgi:hypothetical protein
MMDFVEATEFLVAGGKIQRQGWREVQAEAGEGRASMWVEMREDELAGTSFPVLMLRKADGTTRQLPAYRPTVTDKFANDWQRME